MIDRRPPEHVYLFQHVSKCAGTTLVQALGQTGRAGICMAQECATKHDVRRSLRRELVSRRISPGLIRTVFGHRVYYGMHHLFPHSPRYLTILRDPRERVISLYNHHCDIAFDENHIHHERDRAVMLGGDRLISFEEWFDRHYSGNHLVRFLYYAMEGELVHEPREMTAVELQAAKRFLDQCWFIGFADRGDEDIGHVCRAVGVKTPVGRANVSGDHLSTPRANEFNELIAARDRWDVELFQYALELREASDRKSAAQ